MSEQNSWHNQDKFWELFEPILFNQQRQSSTKVEVEQVVSLLKIQHNDRILDLCCGTGRHSLEMSQQGFDVVGVDRTASFIEKAKQKAEKNNLKAEFIVGDMREYCQPSSFNIVMNLFGSFGYFEDPDDDRQVVENMYASLYPGGRFLIETMGKEILARGFQEREWSEEGDTLVLAERKPQQHWGRIQTRWIVIKGNQRVEHTVSVRSYSAVELSSLLADCGFAKVQVYGDLEGLDYDQGAKRLVVIGTK
ncbi:MAG: methyltransferase domain-containing protein [Phycisphaerae bacterium]|nr:class I SAM-dependent methyltransferase [Gammaproteobacteria bacterium]NIV02535.1 methyltransferase domain-containing protein [Phycisphaerae bacterium]